VRSRTIVLAVIVAALGAGCAQPGYDASKLHSELVRAGVPETKARCVTTALENTFDTGQLASRSEPTLAEEEKTRSILKRCGVTNLQPLA
jgi:hypothetical protein